MPLQNRVDPFGAIHAVAAHGLFTGNRGVIHDPETRSLLGRRWSTQAWIVCNLIHPKGLARQPMGRNAPGGGAGWTELFFLDEVTALAAGHRPCFYCRRNAAKAFAIAFARGLGHDTVTAPQMDRILHGERRASGGRPPTLSPDAVRALPDGAVVAYGRNAFAVKDGKLLSWAFTGYGTARPSCRGLPPEAALVTPPATVAALRAGFRPVWHASVAHKT
ncbi:MAG TPA: hypothetical protein GX405_02430 [Rhizobiales bacterium]|nr:hypothetical protein [Hyphomicrobiales bacterium]